MYTIRALSDFMNVKVEGGDAGGSGGAVGGADVCADVGGADVVADVGADVEVGQEVMLNMIHHTEYVLNHLNQSSDFMYVKVGGEDAEGSREGADDIGQEVRIR